MSNFEAGQASPCKRLRTVYGRRGESPRERTIEGKDIKDTKD